MHYALVSDLMSKEEFDGRVEEKMSSVGGVLDEVVASMIVVDELGRSHIKIGDIPTARSQIVSFFGKIIEKSEPREFLRPADGEEEPQRGLVLNMVLGDPTGTVKLTLWDSAAAAASELSVGEVLEVAAKPKFGKKEAVCAALRESCVEIVETKSPPKSDILTAPLEVKVLHAFPLRFIEKRNGKTAQLQEFIVGDETGCARLVTWTPDIFADVDVGACISVDGVNRKEDDGVVEYVALDSASVSPLARDIKVLSCGADEAVEGRTSIVSGKVVSVGGVRKFTTRRGTESRVRNLKIAGRGKFVFAALWGENADDLFLPGDEVEVLNSVARLNKFGEIELSVGRDSAVRVLFDGKGEEICARGLVILRPEGLSLDDGKDVRILVSEDEVPVGAYVEVCGVLQNGRLYADSVIPVSMDAGEILSRIEG